jgi:hypothetical protein
MHLILIEDIKHIYYRSFTIYLTFFLNKSKYVMNQPLLDIYNNLHNYSATKGLFTSPPVKVKIKNFICFILKTNTRKLVQTLSNYTVVKILSYTKPLLNKVIAFVMELIKSFY